MNIQSYYSEASKTDREHAIAIIKEWSQDNSHSDIDWRRMHAASNELAVQLHRAGRPLKELKQTMLEAKDTVERTEAMAFQTQRLTLLGDGLSATQATELARRVVPLNIEVMNAQIAFAKAVANLSEFEIELDGLREMEQGAKSTAKMLKEEPA